MHATFFSSIDWYYGSGFLAAEGHEWCQDLIAS
jgi:hypothetical protein